jgi:acyl-CoA synthetase (AMP-forming)/AMP-acid ligase II
MSEKRLPFLTPVERLRHWAQVKPDQTAFIFLEQGETEAECLTFGELHRRASDIAVYLRVHAEPGERALLVYPTGLAFVEALCGCLYAGVIPIPTNPPGLNRSARRLDAIARDARASLVLSTAEFMRALDGRQEQLPDLQARRWVDHAVMRGDGQGTGRMPTAPTSPQAIEVKPGDLAFIQYTSGSTNVPKGVMVSYRNLSYNCHALRQFRQAESREDSVIVTWTPLFHDMGLIYGIFQGIFDGHMDVLMTPIAFIQKPARWLRAISRYRGTLSGGPNFAYGICATKISTQECQGLDLSSWRLAYNGAEPVRAETHARFAEKFAPYGLNPEILQPAYGLAEATLVVSAYGGMRRTITFPAERVALENGRMVRSDPGDEKNCRHVVDCGPPLLETRLAIVNPQTGRRCAADEIGEIWMAGGNVAEGYWDNPEATQATYGAVIQDSGEGPFLRTGDLGFLYEGDLYITGRHKDLIIVRGRNYYPQDIEYTVEKCHPAMRPGCGAAFSIQVEGNEQLVIVQEVRQKPSADKPSGITDRGSNAGDGQKAVAGIADPGYRSDTRYNWQEIINKARYEVAREHGLRVYGILLIPPGAVPKTSSGKIMRAEARSMYLEDQFEAVAGWRAPGK